MLRDRDGDNTYYGGAGDDRVSPGGLVGNDSILGGTGNDFLSGGYGDDVIDSSDGGIGAFDNPYPPLPADAFPTMTLTPSWAARATTPSAPATTVTPSSAGRATTPSTRASTTTPCAATPATTPSSVAKAMTRSGATPGDDTIYGGLSPIFPDSLNIPDDEGDLVPDNGLDTIYGGAGDDTIYRHGR